ncbi:MAG: tetratricopeptide repeat protein [Alphaproteobacteria bacterium]|nr:tetratricopeptide repeat protein [Alphaproteobacteria bacterium]MCW5742927.1 tetratricopeptide repeat protein [Alphaproteobacteria bacterium]
MRRWAALVALLLALPWSEGRAQDRAEQWRRCEGLAEVDREIAVAACTALIESGHEAEQSLAAAFYHRGHLRGFQEADQAVDDLTQAIRLNPWFPAAYLERGNVRAGKRDYESAIADFTAAIRLDPSDAFAFLRRGQAYLARNLPADALNDFEEAIRLNPYSATAYQGRSKAYEDLGQHEKAKQNNPNPWTYICGYGVLYQEFDEAMAACNRALAIAPDYPVALRWRAMMLLMGGRRDAALADLDRALRIEPSSSLGRELRGIAHLLGGNLDAAIADLDIAVQWDTKRLGSMALYARGLARQRRGDQAGGAADIERAKSRNSRIEARAAEEYGLK